MQVAVLANGSWDPVWGKQVLAKVDFLVCADGGANAAWACGRLPDVLVGDLDSVSAEVLTRCQEAGVQVARYPREKDETDLELALQWAVAKSPGATDIWLFGASGGRLDHLLGNVALLLRYARQGLRVVLKDPGHEAWVSLGQDEIKGQEGDQLSVIVLSETAVVSTAGLYYALDHAELRQDSPRGVSNVFAANTCRIQVHAGWVLIVLLRQPDF